MTESPDARRAFASSGLHAHLSRLCEDAAVATISRARVSSRALNAALRRRLSAPPGDAESLIADPAFEIAREWRAGPRSFGALSGGLLRPELVGALAGAGEQAMPKDRLPWLHQHRAWEAALSDARSVLVSSGTGSGKTECFLIPILNDLLTRVRPGGGVQAILIYPLNALIESQRERLNAWAGGLGGRVRFALYNGDTEETERRAKEKSTKVELRSRAAIRDKPPEILVTNVTMLEYMLLRGEDRRILEASEGALRWIVLDEAHSYIGSQAAEMAMLLRRVRAAFQVRPDQVRLMATSATIAGEDDARDKLKTFLAALAGTGPERCAVIEGETVETALPAPGPDLPLSRALAAPDLDALGAALASHPRLQRLRRALDRDAVTLGDAARMLFDAPDRRRDAQEVLDAAAEARHGGKRLMPWRAHLFERALGGVWVCIDPACPERDAELAADGGDWPFGAVSTLRRDRCGCGAPVFELVACSECGAPHLAVGVAQGAHPTLAPLPDESVDEFAIDVEPDDRSEEEEAENRIAIGTRQWLGAPRDALHASWIDAVDGAIYDNAPPDGGRPVRLRLIAQAEDRGCCAGAADARLAPMRFGPAFLMGTAAPALLDAFAPPEDRQGLPAGGRKAISFSDSRQGVARLAARLQQDSERTMVRAFLYHAVQSGGAGGDPERVAKLERQRDRILAKLESEEDEDEREDLQERLDDKLRELARLTGAEAAPVPWNDLVSGLATQEDLRGFAMEVWKNRAIMGDGLQERPEDLARMLLLRELLRRPKVQNNPETMGLLRLAFPKLEEKALLQTLPQPFPDAGLDREDWRGLALAAVDMTFRIQLAVDVDTWIIPVVAPRTGYLKSYAPPGTRKGERSEHAYGWPSGRSGRSRLVKLVYALIGGGVGDRAAEDRADIVLDALWRLIGSTICIDVGRGEMRLDFSQAAVQRLDKAWICPVTRRPFGYAAARRSPFAPDRFMSPRDWPRLPQANRGGLSDQASNEVAEWVRRDPVVADLREAGFWTDLHDRIAAYPRYLRAQEHSAQIPRKVLQRYEETFKAGGINLLNCSTTMEMGVDIPNVRLVLNANAPPALSNYRQRVGRAGRRNEPWAFGVTFCRDLPLDRRAFSDPCAYLRQKIVAPKVLLDSPAQIARHANAMLLAAWLADATEGLRIQENVGAFLGATKTLEETPDHAAPIDAFIAALRGEWGAAPALADRIATLLRGSVLADEPPRRRMEATAEAADRFARRWRREHGALLERAALLDPDGGRDGGDAAMSLTLRAARMRGEFLLAELARRGFAPSYGFPTDVVAFDHRAGLRGEEGDAAPAFGFRARGASRPLDIAIREYAPGAEVVIDGLVHMSEGVRPAWSAGTDASRLEDLGAFWRCERCGGAGMTSQSPETCPACGERVSHVRRTLRPAGFLGRRKPHSGYEMLAQTPYQRPEIVAAGADWQALPDPEAGRFRSAPEGHVHSLSSGAQGGGFAICLDCGRAEAMPPPDAAFATPLPEALRRHAPLAPVRNRTRDGLCPASDAPHRIQRHVHLAHDAMTDVFEFQAPHGVQPKPCLAFGAGLREALADMLGVEAREIGVTLADSRGPAGEARRSVCLFDRAPGGAGYATRLADGELFTAALRGALERLACPENCGTGCPACVLRPDLNQRDVEMDREGGRALAADLLRRIALPDALRVFGEGTAMLGRRLGDWLADEERSGRIADLTVFLQGSPKDWDFEGAGFAPIVRRLRDRARVAIPQPALTAAGWNHGVALALIGLGCEAARIAAAPDVGGLPLLAAVRRPDGTIVGVACSEAQDAAPGSDWGRGDRAPLLRGPLSAPPAMQAVPMANVARISAGDGWLLHAGASLDGPLAGFGARFWKRLSEAAPLPVAAMRATGIAELRYSDRYLLSPAALALFAETMRACPGLSGGAMTVDLAPGGGAGRPPRRLHHGYALDAERTAVLQALLPAASVRLHPEKADLDHFRAMHLRLRDGRTVMILLDQGFGAWRTIGPDRHDFGATAADQARALKRARVDIETSSASGSPIHLRFEEAPE